MYQCFDARCRSKGDAIDLWAALHPRDLRSAALDLVYVFALEPSRPSGTEKWNGSENGWRADPRGMHKCTRVDACSGTATRRVAGPRQRKNPVITETGLDTLPYICSAWFSALPVSHWPTVPGTWGASS